MEGHHSESHRLCQRRHSAAAEYIAAAAGLPGTSRWRRNRWGCNHHALSTPKAKIADSPDPPRQRLHRIIRSTSSSRLAPSSSRTTARRRSYSHQAPKRSAASIRPARWALCRHACARGTSDLPYTVGSPAFTRELRQVQWPSTKNFKPDVPEKYDGKSPGSPGACTSTEGPTRLSD